MCEAETMQGFLVVQVMENTKSHDNVRVSESRVIPKRRGVADYERSLARVRTFG
jgi:hypothetical protein